MSNDYHKILMSKYRNKGLLLDSNLLLLYFIGLYDYNKISTFKRTTKYTIEDFDIISHIINFFDRVITTPHIVTEISNLSGQLSGKIKSCYFEIFAKQIKLLEENSKPSKDLCDSECFRKFGLTDSGIVEISRNTYLVMTDDLPLSGYLQSQRIDVINFNHIRYFDMDI